MKFGHIADIHLGRNPQGMSFREKDFINVFNYAVDRCIDEGVDFILLSGDLFDKSTPHPNVLSSAIAILQKLKERDIPVFAIEGNHEQSRKKGVLFLLHELNLLYPLGLYNHKIEGYYLNHKEWNNKYYTYADIGDVEVWGLQYLSKSIHSQINLLSPIEPTGGYNIMMLHQGVKGVFSNPLYDDIAEMPFDYLNNAFDYYAMGHIHEKIIKKYSNFIVAYPSSLERCDYGEYNKVIEYYDELRVKEVVGSEKGFILYNGREFNHIPTPARDMYRIYIKGTETDIYKKLEEIKNIIEKGSMLDIYILPEHIGAVSIEKLDSYLLKWKNDGFIAHYKFKITHPNRENIHSKTELKPFTQYLKEKNEKFLEYAKTIEEYISKRSNKEIEGDIPKIAEELLNHIS